MNIRKIVKLFFPKHLWSYIRRRLILLKHRRLSNNISYLVDYCDAGKLGELKLERKKELPTQGLIWQYWAQGYDNLPPLIELCLKSVNECASNYTIIRLSDDNVGQYIDLPDWLLERKKEMSLAHYADVLRCMLLSAYGGIWLDAATYLTGNLPAFLFKDDFFMFQRDLKEPNKKYWENTFAYYFGWERGFRVNVLIGVIYAKPSSKVISDMCLMLLHYWKHHHTIPDYFFFQILFDVYIRSHPELNCRIVSDCPPHLLRQLINDFPLLTDVEDIKKMTSIHSLNYKNPNAVIRLKTLLKRTQM